MTQKTETCLVLSNDVERQSFLRTNYDSFPPHIRKLLREADFNLCDACVLEALVGEDVTDKRKTAQQEQVIKRLIEKVRKQLGNECVYHGPTTNSR